MIWFGWLPCLLPVLWRGGWKHELLTQSSVCSEVSDPSPLQSTHAMWFIKKNSFWTIRIFWPLIFSTFLYPWPWSFASRFVFLERFRTWIHKMGHQSLLSKAATTMWQWPFNFVWFKKNNNLGKQQSIWLSVPRTCFPVGSQLPSEESLSDVRED